MICLYLERGELGAGGDCLIFGWVNGPGNILSFEQYGVNNCETPTCIKTEVNRRCESSLASSASLCARSFAS